MRLLEWLRDERLTLCLLLSRLLLLWSPPLVRWLGLRALGLRGTEPGGLSSSAASAAAAAAIAASCSRAALFMSSLGSISEFECARLSDRCGFLDETLRRRPSLCDRSIPPDEMLLERELFRPLDPLMLRDCVWGEEDPLMLPLLDRCEPPELMLPPLECLPDPPLDNDPDRDLLSRCDLDRTDDELTLELRARPVPHKDLLCLYENMRGKGGSVSGAYLRFCARVSRQSCCDRSQCRAEITDPLPPPPCLRLGPRGRAVLLHVQRPPALGG